MTIAAGSTANFTADAAGWTVTVTPAGGSAVTFHTTFDGAPHVLQSINNDDIAGAPIVTKVNKLIAASSEKSGGNTHVRA